VARCFAGDVDIAEALVRDGLALAYRRYSMDYVLAETGARLAGRGMWRGDFEEPWAWRRG
jgi:endonuclease YncB( thermonuclease family)